MRTAAGPALRSPGNDGPDASERVAGLVGATSEGSEQAAAAAATPGSVRLRLDAAYLRRGCILVVLEYSLRRARSGLMLPSRRLRQPQAQWHQDGRAGGMGSRSPGAGPQQEVQAAANAGEVEEESAAHAALWAADGGGGGALTAWQAPALSQQQLTAAFGLQLVPADALVVHCDAGGGAGTGAGDGMAATVDDGVPVILAQHYTGPTGSEAQWRPRPQPHPLTGAVPAENAGLAAAAGEEARRSGYSMSAGEQPAPALALLGAGPCILATRPGQPPVQLVALARGVLAAGAGAVGAGAKRPQVLARYGGTAQPPARCAVSAVGPPAADAAVSGAGAGAEDDLVEDAVLRSHLANTPGSSERLRGVGAPAHSTPSASLQQTTATATATAAAAAAHVAYDGGVAEQAPDVCSLQITLTPCPSPGLLLLEVELDPERDAAAGPERAAAAPLLSPVLPLVVIDNMAVQMEINALAAASAAAASPSTMAGAQQDGAPAAAAPPLPLEPTAAAFAAASLPGWFCSFLYDFGSFLDLLRTCRTAGQASPEAAAAEGRGGGRGGRACVVDMSVSSWLVGQEGEAAGPDDASAEARDGAGASPFSRVIRCASERFDPADAEPQGGCALPVEEEEEQEAGAVAGLSGGPQAGRWSWLAPATTDGGSSWLSSAAGDRDVGADEGHAQSPGGDLPPQQQQRQPLEAAMQAGGGQSARAGPGGDVHAPREQAAREPHLWLDDCAAAKPAPAAASTAAAVADAGELLYVAAGIAAYACRQGLAATLSYVLDAVRGLGQELLAAAAVQELQRTPAVSAVGAGGRTGGLECVQLDEAPEGTRSGEAEMLSHSPLLLLDAAVAAQWGGLGLGHLAMQSGSTDVLTTLLMHAREPGGGGAGRAALAANAVAAVGPGRDGDWLQLATLSECTALFVRPGPGGLTPLHLAALLQDRPVGHEAAQLLLSLCPLAAHAWFEARDGGGRSAAEYAQSAGAAELNEQVTRLGCVEDVCRETRSMSC